jgi:hypothetical protein
MVVTFDFIEEFSEPLFLHSMLVYIHATDNVDHKIRLLDVIRALLGNKDHDKKNRFTNVVRIIAKQLPKLVEKEKDLKYCSLFTQA